MKTRREFLIAGSAGLCTLGAPLASFAQQPPARFHRIGFLGPTSAAGIASRLEALRAGLRELGYVEGKNLVIEFRWAEGKYDRLPELAAELVRLKVDLIVTHGGPGIRAAKQATTTIPIVMAVVADAVADGLVASLARPGGNITGLSFFGPELNAKRLELLKETFPRIRRVAFLFQGRGSGVNLRAMEAAAGSLKVELQQFAVRSAAEFESAFATMSKQRVEAVAITEDTMFVANLAALVSLAARQRIPSIGFVEVAEAGGLMAYGVNIPAMFRRAAVFVDKILKGAKPGDLPIERATTFELVINRKAAKALGVTIPQSILARADRVIE
jgi:putative ABC transport system substrate-binding protein